jgi:Carboxypeptidase regulatory-like domain
VISTRYQGFLVMVLLCGLMVVGRPSMLPAQVGTASLGGFVTDPSGAAIPNASVRLESVSEKYSRIAATGASGQYALPALPPADYRLVVGAPGFSTQTRTGISLASGQGSTLDVTLALSSTKQQVTVEAALPLLDTTTATVGAELWGQQFVSLPMVARSFTTLIKTLPGVATVPNADSAGSAGINGTSILPAVYGQRQRDNAYAVDGMIALEPNFQRLARIPPPRSQKKGTRSREKSVWGAQRPPCLGVRPAFAKGSRPALT